MEFLLKEREAGRIRNLGFSFHGSKPEFDQLLPSSHDMVRLLGVYRDKIPPETEEETP